MAYSLEQVLADWKIDAEISASKLDKELYRTPMLHAKYLDAYVYFRAKLSAAEKKYNHMTFARKKYYRGESTQEELALYGWSQYQGLKMSSSEFNQQKEFDPILVDLNEVRDGYKVAVTAIEYIMKSIGGRDWTLKTIVDYQKFQAGN